MHCNVLYTIVQYNTIPKQCAEEVSLSSDNPRGHCDSPSKGYQKTLLMTIKGHEISCVLNIAQNPLGDQISSNLNNHY